MITRKTTSSRKKTSRGLAFDSFFMGIGLTVGLIFLALTIYLGYQLQVSPKRLIPISVLALIAGVLFESRRLTDSWKVIAFKALGAFVSSFFVFLPGKREVAYNLETHIEVWPYAFMFFFIIFSIVVHGDKVIPKLTEGITLLQSMAVIYWAVGHGFIDTESLILKLLTFIGVLFSLFSVFHAFTHLALSRTSRLILSVWSSIVMMLFAADNIFRVYQNEQIENAIHLTDGLYIGLQYFLLGISSIYIVQNFLMLVGFLPGKGTFFNAAYFRDLNELKSSHIKRYSAKQVSILHSLFCVLFTGTIFALNYYYQFMAIHVAVWAVFVIFPLVISLYSFATGSRSRRY